MASGLSIELRDGVKNSNRSRPDLGCLVHVDMDCSNLLRVKESEAYELRRLTRRTRSFGRRLLFLNLERNCEAY